ncbi:MAG: hypothetical protein QJR02_01785 [Sinobacteraceae bacterium]|nr:hypothetical protein [Nevskiaceae bacterium]
MRVALGLVISGLMALKGYPLFAKLLFGSSEYAWALGISSVSQQISSLSGGGIVFIAAYLLICIGVGLGVSEFLFNLFNLAAPMIGLGGSSNVSSRGFATSAPRHGE